METQTPGAWPVAGAPQPEWREVVRFKAIESDEFTLCAERASVRSLGCAKQAGRFVRTKQAQRFSCTIKVCILGA